MPSIENFILCEDVRIEASGLLTLVGVIHGAVAPSQLALRRLACVASLSDMAAIQELKFSFSLYTDTNEEIAVSNVFESKRPPQNYHTIIHAFDQPLLLPRFGVYQVRLVVQFSDSAHKFVRNFHVVEQPAAPPQ